MGWQQQFLTPLNDNSAIQYENSVGIIRQEGNSVYKYVKFTGTTAVAVGDSVCYTDNTLTVVDGANAAVPAGISMCVAAAGAVSFGWILVKGRVVVNTVSSGANGNEMSMTGAAAKAIKVRALVTDAPIGTLVDSVAKVLQAEFPF